MRALQNKGHAHLQYSVAVFLGGCMHSSHYTVGWSAPQLGWVFWKKKKLPLLPGIDLRHRFFPELFVILLYSQASILEGPKLKF